MKYVKRRFFIFLPILFFIIGSGSYLLYQKYYYPVDLVYLWVDGNDHNWMKKKIYWQQQYGKLPDNAVNVARFRQFDELKYSLRSVEKNMPWIHHIYIITDNQIPEWLESEHPKVSIIDHSEIMPRDALPTFNSGALETRIAHIPNLSEHFIFANDDCFVRVPLKKNFFFNKDGNPRVFVKYKQRTYDTNLWLAQIQKAHFLISQKYPLNFVITPSHNMEAYRKSFYLEAMAEYAQEADETVHSKFRKPTDLNRIIVELRDRMLHRNEMIAKDEKKTLPENCYSFFSLISNDFFTLSDEKPCLFCLNDYEGKSDSDILITLQILESLYPKKSSFER